jgi:hypothetical protein
MTSTTPITSLTADYDAIERAIRETSRGRWFLTCYLERNRSAETRMLLSAIAKLENAMRDNGVVMRETGKYSVLATLRDAIDEARCDIAHMPMPEERGAHTESLRRFDFENIPASGTEDLRTMRDAALSIRSAAHVLHSAGVFHGVAQQIADNAQTIERSCLAHETTLLRASRMAALICELEAELITAAEDDSVEPFYDGPPDPCRQDNGKNIPDDVVEELSLALAECYDGGEFNGSAKR